MSGIWIMTQVKQGQEEIQQVREVLRPSVGNIRSKTHGKRKGEWGVRKNETRKGGGV